MTNQNEPPAVGELVGLLVVAALVFFTIVMLAFRPDEPKSEPVPTPTVIYPFVEGYVPEPICTGGPMDRFIEGC